MSHKRGKRHWRLLDTRAHCILYSNPIPSSDLCDNNPLSELYFPLPPSHTAQERHGLHARITVLRPWWIMGVIVFKACLRLTVDRAPNYISHRAVTYESPDTEGSVVWCLGIATMNFNNNCYSCMTDDQFGCFCCKECSDWVRV